MEKSTLRYLVEIACLGLMVGVFIFVLYVVLYAALHPIERWVPEVIAVAVAMILVITVRLAKAGSGEVR